MLNGLTFTMQSAWQMTLNVDHGQVYPAAAS
jgi:hypothetical protein